MDFLPFYIYWILGGDLSSYFSRCGSNSTGDTDICISEWSCARIAKGINIGPCKIDQSEDICCKIPTLNVSVDVKPSAVLEETKFDKAETKPTISFSDVFQTEDSSIGSVKHHTSFAPIEKDVSARLRNVFGSIVNYRNPVKVEVNHNMRIPVETEASHNMRETVAQVKDFNLRRPILPSESHDLRWPVLDEQTHDLRQPYPGYNTETYATEIVNMGKEDKTNSKEDAISNIDDNFQRFYKYPSDRISGENNDYVRCVENLSNTHSNISNQFMQMETAEEKLYREMLDASSEVCGRSHTTATAKLVGGRNSTYLQWPWMVSLRQRYRNKIRHKCGATLLNNLWIITAAHCVDLVPKWKFVLRLGNHNLNDDEEPHAYVVRYIDRIIKHPKFDPMSYENDLALLLVNSPVEFRPNIIPICLPKKIDEIEGRISVVLGWGRVKEGGFLSGSLQELNLPVLSNRECEEMYGKGGTREEIKNVFLCAGTAEGGIDTCEGDSGGPMLILDTDDRWALIGLVSWGKICGAPYQPGVYTRITEYVDWIDGILACHILKKEFE